MSTTIMRNRNVSINTIPKPPTKRSIFPARWSRKQTMNASFITPIMRKRVLPGDTWSINLDNFSRLSPQITCPMDNLIAETFIFFVPDRLTWDNAPYFYGAIKDPNISPTPDYTIPMVEIPASANTAGSIYNYITGGAIDKKLKISALPFRAYNLIYNEYFRDTDCQSPLTVNKGDSGDLYTDFELKRIHKSRDYFTNSTRDIQKFDSVTIPIGTTAPVIGNGLGLGVTTTNQTTSVGYLNPYLPEGFPHNSVVVTSGKTTAEAVGTAASGNANQSLSVLGVTENPSLSGLIADLTNAQGAQLSALRQAIMTQEYLEALNRGGTSYRDIMQNIYGVTIPDLTIQRPEYLGGTSAPFFTNPVVQTSETANTPQGNIAGFGTFGESGKVIHASFQEFGYIIGVMVIKSVPQYQQGIDRDLTAEDKYEVYNPFYVNASDQAIKMGELYAYDYDAVDSDGNIKNDKTFGFTPMYEHYRRFNNEIAGELNSDYQYTLDAWTYAEKFENEPANNSSFMEDHTYETLDRSMAIVYEDENKTIKSPQIMADVLFTGYVARQLPTYGQPKISALC